MSDKITFSDLVERIAEETGASKRVIHGLFKEVVAVSKEGLLRDGHVYISGLGTFKLKWRDARQGINPQTGEPIVIPAQNRVYFKPEAGLRRFINRGYSLKKPEIIGIGMKQVPSMPKSRASFFRKKRASLGVGAALVALLLLLLVVRFSPFQPAHESSTPPDDTAQTEPIHRYRIAEEKETGKEAQAAVQPDQASEPEAVSSGIADEERTIEEDKQAGEIIQPDLPSEPEAVPLRIAEEKETGKEAQAAVQPDQASESVGVPGGVCNVRPGNSLWGIAESFYMDPYLWPNIFRANTDVVRNPDALQVGLMIHVPSLEGTIGSLSRNDIVNIIDGYMQVYLAYRRLGKRNARYYLWVAHQYNMPQVLQKYEDKIAESDRDFVLRIKGSPRI